VKSRWRAFRRWLHPYREVVLACGYSVIIDREDEWIQQQLVLQGSYEPQVARLLTVFLRPGDVFFDVGANIGCHTLVAAAAGASVHAFEPVPRIAVRLHEHIRLNNLHGQVLVVEAALSDRAGLAPFHVASRLDDGSHSLLPGVPADRIDVISVPTQTLDAYAEAARCGGPNVVKIDVEGSEALVLRGAEKALERTPQPVWIFETADRLADGIGESAASVVDAFRRRGYLVFRIPDLPGPLVPLGDARVSGDLANYLAVHGDSPRMHVVRRLAE
jgi:FkbM family methyltransferase